MAQDADEPESDDVGPGPLAWWQRALAGLVGVAMTGAGGYSVFKTSNQAGSATLLIFGCIFMISSLNGAQIQGLKLKDADVQWQRTKIRRRLAEAAEHESPETARQILDALNTADPQAARDPVVQYASGAVYEREVLAALDRLASSGRLSAVVPARPNDFGADYLIDTTAGRIAVIVKYQSRGLFSNPNLSVPFKRAEPGYPGLLVVTNGRLSSSAQDTAMLLGTFARTKVGMVRWIDHQDDEALYAAILDLMSRIQEKESL